MQPHNPLALVPLGVSNFLVWALRRPAGKAGNRSRIGGMRRGRPTRSAGMDRRPNQGRTYAQRH